MSNAVAEPHPSSRRAVIRTAIAGVVGAVAATLGRPSKVRAGVDGDVVLGEANAATATTSLVNLSNSEGVLSVSGLGTALSASSSGSVAILAAAGSGNGVAALTESGIGVYAESETIGVNGNASSGTGYGVIGFATGGGTGVYGLSSTSPSSPEPGPANTGVHGRAAIDADSVGVRGDSEAGTGVRATATTGTGVLASTDSGTAVIGRSAAGVGVVGASFEGADLGWPDPITPSTGVYGISEVGTGVYGASWAGAGVYAATNATNVAAIVGEGGDGAGIHGHAGPWPVPPSPLLTGVLGTAFGGGTAISGFSGPDQATPPQPPAKTGVHGYAAHDASSRGVVGESPAGQGVRGLSTTGIGLRGYSESGVAGSFETASGMALVTKGRVRFQNIAGRTSIPSGASSVMVAPGVDLTSGSSVLATINGDPGGTTAVQRVTVDPLANTFTVHLTSSTASAAKVAWFVLDQ